MAETLEALQERNLSFKTPEVLWTKLHDGRRYTLYTNIPGQRLSFAWPNLSDETKSRIAEQVAGAHNELSKWQAKEVSSARGKWFVPPIRVTIRRSLSTSYFKHMRESLEKFGYEFEDTVFAHLMPMPSNIIVDGAGSLVGITDWTLAGFVPKQMVLTRLRHDPMLRGTAKDDPVNEGRQDWNRRFDNELAKLGFTARQ